MKRLRLRARAAKKEQKRRLERESIVVVLSKARPKRYFPALSLQSGA